MSYQRRYLNTITTSMLFIVFIGVGIALAGDLSGKLKTPDPGNTQIITLQDGSTLRGEITEVGATEVKFKSNLGEMNINIAMIKEIREVSISSFKDGKYWFPNPNKTRLFFSPTGKMLKAGDGYFSDWYIFFPGFNYGITDNITLGGGFSIFPWWDIPKEQFLYFTPKIGISTGEKLDFAVSALIVVIPDVVDDDDETLDNLEDENVADFVGIVYGLGTYGSDDHHFTLGLGYGYVDKDFADKPAVIIGGETRVFRRMSLVGESWILPGVDDPLIFYGMRFFGEGLAVDLAFITILGEDGFFPGLPYVGFVYNF